MPRSTTSSDIPLWRCVGSVFAATITRSALIPFVMNVFDPFRTYSSPSRIAVVAIPARSEPVPGSVMATAVISSPEAIPGSQRLACSSLQYSMKYGVQMSLCSVSPSPAPPIPAAASSSASTTLNRKSSGTSAAPLLRDRHPEEAVLARRGEHLARHDPGGLPVGVVRHHLLGDERRDRAPERLVVIGEQVAGGLIAHDPSVTLPKIVARCVVRRARRNKFGNQPGGRTVIEPLSVDRSMTWSLFGSVRTRLSVPPLPVSISTG